MTNGPLLTNTDRVDSTRSVNTGRLSRAYNIVRLVCSFYSHIEISVMGDTRVAQFYRCIDVGLKGTRLLQS